MHRTIRIFLCLGLGACSTDTFMGDAGMDMDSGNSPDSPVVMDGSKPGMDAMPPIEAGPPPRFCASVDAAFCADFDIPNDAGAGFLSPSTSGGFTLTFPSPPDAGNRFSKPTVMEVGIPTSAGHASLVTVVNSPLDAGTTTLLKLDLDVFLPEFGTTPPIYAFVFGAVGAATVFGLGEGGGTWGVITQSGAAVKFDVPPTTGEWGHMSLTILLSASGNATLVMTTSAGTSTAVSNTFNTLGAPNSAQLQLGVSDSTPPNAAAKIEYDNVIVRLE